MWDMSDSDISVPIEISAAAFRTASRSSGRITAKSVVAAFVRKPISIKERNGYFGIPFDKRTHQTNDLRIRDIVGDDLRHFREVPTVPFL